MTRYSRKRRRKSMQDFKRMNRRSCGKVVFTKINEAKSAASELGLRVYKCRHCHNWHMTSDGVDETVYGRKNA